MGSLWQSLVDVFPKARWLTCQAPQHGLLAGSCRRCKCPCVEICFGLGNESCGATARRADMFTSPYIHFDFVHPANHGSAMRFQRRWTLAFPPSRHWLDACSDIAVSRPTATSAASCPFVPCVHLSNTCDDRASPPQRLHICRTHDWSTAIITRCTNSSCIVVPACSARASCAALGHYLSPACRGTPTRRTRSIHSMPSSLPPPTSAPRRRFGAASMASSHAFVALLCHLEHPSRHAVILRR